ncbi:DUF397 domain-containing protein [Streptomyces sp. PsTaAH-124]|uniref:DUF397 domain-containing protein n=1 Tax=Streptomyces sp. PsTaAH-124 TaxID=1157638 RepID=UPI00037E407F|nr:DUF397 domain-containing protein [Streptomyces sp. PsTaAH-124]
MAPARQSENIQWRRSSYSGNTGGNCIECAPLGAATWVKSSYSGNTGGECVEYAHLTAHIALRDSKNPAGGHFVIAPEVFSRFVGAAARGEL